MKNQMNKNFEEENQNLSKKISKEFTNEIKINIKNETEQEDYEKWLVIKERTKNQGLFLGRSVNVPKFKLSDLEKHISLLTLISMNEMRYGAFDKVTNAALALVPLFKDIFLVDQGKHEWPNRDLFFNAVPGLLYFENIIEYIFGERNKNSIYKGKLETKGIDSIQQAVGAALAKKKINELNPGLLTGKIFIYAEIEQIVSGEIADTLEFIREKRLDNILFVLSATDKTSILDFEKAKKSLRIAKIKILIASKPYNIIKNKIKTASKQKKSAAVIVMSRSSLGTHWESQNVKTTYPTNIDIQRVAKDFGLLDLNLLDLSNPILANFKVYVRKRTLISWDNWNRINGRNIKKINEIIFKNHWDTINKQEFKNKFKLKNLNDLWAINVEIIEMIKNQNPNLVINVAKPSISANIALGMASYKQRTIIEVEVENSEKLINSLREAKRLKTGTVVVLKYDRRRIDNVDLYKIIKTYNDSFENVINPANLNELIDAWSLAQRSKAKITIIIIDEAPIFQNKLLSKKNVGTFNAGGYIIKKRSKITRPVDFVFYGSGTVINDVAYLAQKAENLEGLNIQVVSIPWENKIKEAYKRKILPSTAKKVRFESTGETENLVIQSEKGKIVVVKIPPAIWRSKNKKEIIKNIMKK